MEPLVQPNKRIIAESTAHSAISAVVGDALGRTLNHYNYPERSYVIGEWVKTSRGEYPEHRLHPEQTGKPSLNTEVMYLTLELLADSTPLTPRTVTEFEEYYRDLIEPYLQEREDHQVLVGSTLALGYYNGLMSLRSDANIPLLDKLTEMVYSPIAEASGWHGDNAAAMRTLVYLMRKLVVDGYFGRRVVERAIDNGVCNGELAAVLDTFNKLHLNSKFIFSEMPDPFYLEDLSYFESLIVLACFYLYKIDSGAKTIKRPRFMLEDMVKVDGYGLQDFLMIFSALCTVSEHNYLLFVKPLRDGVELRNDLTETIARIIA